MVDTTDMIKCPACDKFMEKIFMKDAGINVDVCLNGCGGIYFDNREMEKLGREEKDIDALLELIEGKTYTQSNDNELRICPACGMPMTKMGAANGEVQIDICHSCGGKFLDNGELQKIRACVNNDKMVDSLIDELVDSEYEEKYSHLKTSPRRVFFEKFVNKLMNK